jgi:hypothetical protein
VKAPTEAELGLYNQGSEHGVWPAVMEKAFAQYTLNHSSLKHSNLEPQEIISHGGNPVYALKLLTGKEVEPVDLSKKSQQEVEKMLETAFAKQPHGLVIATSVPAQTDHGLVPHEVAIVDFDPASNGNGMVMWLNQVNDQGTGRYVMSSLKDFMQEFAYLQIGK